MFRRIRLISTVSCRSIRPTDLVSGRFPARAFFPICRQLAGLLYPFLSFGCKWMGRRQIPLWSASPYACLTLSKV